MNGIPRYCLQSGLNGTIALFHFFSPLTAYLLNDFIVRVIAFIGMFLLLKKHFSRSDEQQTFIAFAVSLCFAVIPSSSMYSGLTVAGQPLLLYAFLNLLNNDKKRWSFIIIILFPFYSSFVLSGFFIGIALGLILVINTIHTKKINSSYLIGLLILCLGYVLVEYNLISFYFSDEFVSHRKEWSIDPVNFSSAFKESVQLLFQTQYHSGAFYTLPIIIAGIVAFMYDRKEKKIRILSISIVSICTFFFAFNYLKFWFADSIVLLKTFQWERFYFLLPVIWFLLFFVALEILLQRKSKSLVYLFLSVELILIIAGNKDYMQNLTFMKKNKDASPNYKEFFATDLFAEIGDYIKKNKKEYRVVSIGMPPSVAQYNGYYTLDSYQTNYLLDYKHEFRKIIEKELDKNEELKNYFDRWGNRCYVFANGLNKATLYGKKEHVELNNLELNTHAFHNMGGEYIFSSVKINNYESNGLKFEKEFIDKNSYWNVYLYSVDSLKSIN